MRDNAPAAQTAPALPRTNDSITSGATAMNLVLRAYQRADIIKLSNLYATGARSIVYQSPTGSGKTVLFTQIVSDIAACGFRVVILGHRQEIVDQINEALNALGVPHGIIAAGHSETPQLPVQIASVATLVNRLDRFNNFNFIIVDEAHHAAAGMWRRILAALPNACILGVTATPLRLDGQGLIDIFELLVIGPSVADLIEGGFLSRFVTFAPPHPPDLSSVHTSMGDYVLGELAAAMGRSVIITDAVNEYERRCPGAPAIAFAVNIEHSQLVARAFAARGWRAAHVDGETPRDERRALIAALGTGEVQVLSNCGLISEGLDVPAVIAAILLRPTKSLALYLQQVGRAMRPAPGKDRAIILDHAGNAVRHGLADTPHEWSLDGRPKGESGEAPVRRCRGCGAVVPAACFTCPECGATLRSNNIIEIRQPQLIETDWLKHMKYWQALQWAGGSKERLQRVAEARGYKPGWVWHRMQEHLK
jgi:superfamily II DNA or RNA helicase